MKKISMLYLKEKLQRLNNFAKEHWCFCLIFAAIILVGLNIRIWNIFTYNTWWADDGGAHIQYVQHLLNFGGLPSPEITYLAWHEPLYYVLVALWAKFGNLFGVQSINWWEFLQLPIFGIFLCGVWNLGQYISNKNYWFSLFGVFLFTILFPGIKLSAYVTNELLVQAIMLILVWLFVHWKLASDPNTKKIVIWTVILSFAMLVKLTAIIVLLGALFIWFLHFVLKRKKQFLIIFFLAIGIVGIINAPWFLYKHHVFGNAFSINQYEKEKHGLLSSPAWKYIINYNSTIFVNDPYWSQKVPQAFGSIIVADTFGDYYNLFQNAEKKTDIKTINGRYTNKEKWAAQLKINRLGLFLYILWICGFLGVVLLQAKNWYKSKKINWEQLFLFVVVAGAWGALVYNNLRHPYLDRGVLKIQFIYFVLPIMTLLAYSFWEKIVSNKISFFLLAWVPVFVYCILAWKILLVL